MPSHISAAGSSKSPALHELIVDFQMQNLLLETDLKVVHVPGELIIQEGTDGLSQGVWLSQLHEMILHATLTAGIFSEILVPPMVLTLS